MMKIKKSLFVLAGFALTFSLVGCGAMTSTSERVIYNHKEGYFEQINVSAKDFEPIQLVFIETAQGGILTYQMLLKEAQRVGGQGMVDVTIEEIRVCSRTKSVMGDSGGCVSTWYGSALAIRYTQALSADHQVSGRNDARETVIRHKGASGNAFMKFLGLGGGAGDND